MKNTIKVLGFAAIIAAIAFNALLITGCDLLSSDPTVTSIKVTTPPTKIVYEQGQDFEQAGMVVTATYSDGKKSAVTDYTVSDFDSTTAGEKTLTVTYKGKKATFTVTVNETVGTPTASPDAGTYNVAQSVTLSSSTEDAAIYYTIDGTEPTASSMLYENPIIIGDTTTLKAIAIKTGLFDSGILTAVYNFSYIPLAAADIFVDGNIASAGGEQWFKFTATVASQYIYFMPGTLPTASVQLYDADGTTTVGAKEDFSYISYLASSASAARTVTIGNEYYIKVTPYVSTDSGTYKIGFNNSTTPPKLTLPATGVTTLVVNKLSDGNIPSAGGEQWFKFLSTDTSQYIHFQTGTLSSVYVQLYTDDGRVSGSKSNLMSSGSSAYTNRTVTNSTWYYIRVTPYSDTGNGAYRIGFNTSTTTPSITIPNTGITVLTADTWTDKEITAGGEQWFRFTSNATTQYIHFYPGTASRVYAQLYGDNGTPVGSDISFDNTTLSVSRTVNDNTWYYIRVYVNSGGGTYRITFGNSTPPAITLPTTGVTTLTVDEWTVGNIAVAGGEQWFKFTATSTSHYIHFLSDTLSSVYVQLYIKTGTPTGDKTYLYTSYISTQRTGLTINNEYYIKVTPSSSIDSGVYKIGFNNNSTPPPITLPTTGITTLTADKWSDGNIATAGGDQWFKFTSTDTTQYIHFQTGTLSSVYVQLYDADGRVSGSRSSLTSSTTNISRTITNDTVYYIKVTPYNSTGSNSSGTYKIGFNTITTPPPITLPTTGVTTLVVNKWSDGNIATADGEQWFKFTSTDTTQYINFQPGTRSSVYVQLYTAEGRVSGSSSYLSDYTSYTSLTVTNGTVYYIKVTPYSSTGSTYKIGFGATSSMSVTLPTTGVTTLVANKWSDGNIASASDEQWFKFTSTDTTQYINFQPGTLSYVYVQLYDAYGDPSGSKSYLGNYTELTVTNSAVYYIKVTPYTSTGSGTYKIGFGASSSMSVTLPTTGVTTLVVNKWSDGNIASAGGEQWFKFTSTATTQYINFQTGTLSSVYVQLYDVNGDPSGSRSYLYDDTPYTSQTVTNSTVYYIKVTPSYSTNSGTYKIGFGASSSMPVTLPTTGVTTLVSGKWSDGNITTAGGEQWFKFTSTATTQYIHFQKGTLDDVYVQMYDADGFASGSRANLYSSTLYTSRTVTNNTVYYIKVTPYSATKSGAYKIGFTTSTTVPAVPSTVTTLVAGIWGDGNITTAGGEQWFTFTATETTQYIHFQKGTLDDVYVQMYDANNVASGSRANLYGNGSNLYTSRTGLTVNTVYYIKVTPYSTTKSGAYKIGFTTSTTVPAAVTTLVSGKWSDGNITTAGGEQWFTFTSTATTQYIHLQTGTLDDVYVQMYDADGVASGSRTNLYSYTLYTSRTVTNNTVYYIKVTPYSSSDKGAYKIGFTTSTTTPTAP